MKCGKRIARQFRGFSLLEMMVVIIITAIMVSMATPLFGLLDKYRLKSATDTLYSDLQFARFESIRNNQNVLIEVASGTAWCYGMTVTSGTTACDCTVTNTGAANYCSLKRVSASDFANTSIPTSSSGVTFTSGTITFTPMRGMSSSGSIVLQSTTQGTQTQVNLNSVGKVSICSPSGTVHDYSTC